MGSRRIVGIGGFARLSGIACAGRDEIAFEIDMMKLTWGALFGSAFLASSVGERTASENRKAGTSWRFIDDSEVEQAFDPPDVLSPRRTSATHA